ILFEDLHDVELTGHSYGGMVITGVMDRIPDRIRHVIYFDAIVPEDGKSAWDVMGGGPQPDTKIENGVLIFPWLKPDSPFPHNVGHPVNTLREPVSFNNPAALALPVTYVPFVPADKSIEERAATDQNWQ